MIPIYITGYERSGTTLVRRLVSMHPGFTYSIVHERRADLMRVKSRKQAVAVLSGLVKNNATASPEAGLKMPYLSFASGRETLLKYMRLFPEAKIVHVIRDPVYAINSQVKTFGHSAGECIKWYFESVPKMTRLLERYGDVFTLHYESLTADPESTVRSLYDWIEEGVSDEHIEKVLHIKEHWMYNGRVMPGLRYFDHIKGSSELVLPQNVVERIRAVALGYPLLPPQSGR